MLETILSQLGINASFGIQFVIFGCIFAFLHFVFFVPLIQHLDKREEKTTLLGEQIREIQARLQERISVYQKKKSAMYQEIFSMKQKAEQEAEVTYQKMVNDGRLQGLKMLQEGRQNLRKQYEKVYKELILRIHDIKNSLTETLWQ